MVAEEENSNLIVSPFQDYDDGFTERYLSSEACWLEAANMAADYAEAMHKAGYHKQIVNRLLEPFMWTRGVITATRAGWDSVFALRCHPDAQPEFQALAYKIKEAIDNSAPKILEFGDWHLPYINFNRILLDNLEVGCHFNVNKVYNVVLENAIKISTSCCAQVSYRQLDDSLEKALKIYDMLNLPANGVFSDKPAHMSPCEHQAQCAPSSYGTLGGNFATLGDTNWLQYRKILERGLEEDLIFIKGNK